MNEKLGSRLQRTALVENSPFRQVDPRVKLLMGLCASLMVMLPLQRLVVFLLLYALLLAWARLLPSAARQIWRMRWVLLVLFVLDAVLISLELAFTVTLRLAILAGVFSLLFATTTPGEFTLALESLRLPYRYSFSLGLAFQSLNLLEEEWQNIQEAQKARGALRPMNNWREGLRQVSDLVALTVPAVVLTTKRAWSITEAAYARGFDSPHRKPVRQLHFEPNDIVISAATLCFTLLLVFWPILWKFVERLL